MRRVSTTRCSVTRIRLGRASWQPDLVTGAVLNSVCSLACLQLSSHRVVHVVAPSLLSAPPIAFQRAGRASAALLGRSRCRCCWVTRSTTATGRRDGSLSRLAIRARRCVPLHSVYFVVFGGLAYGLIVGVAALRRRTWRIPITAAIAAVIALVVLTPFVVSRVRFDRPGGAAGAPRPSSSATATCSLPTRSRSSPNRGVRPCSCAPDRSRREPLAPGRPHEHARVDDLSRFLLSRAASCSSPAEMRAASRSWSPGGGMWVFALGPSLKVGGSFLWEHAGTPVSWLPYRLVLAIPALGALRAPFRTGYVLVAVLVAATAIALHRVLSNRPQRGRRRDGLRRFCWRPTCCSAPDTDTLRGTRRASTRSGEIARLEVRRHGDGRARRLRSGVRELSGVSSRAGGRVCGSFAANPWQSELAYVRSDAFTKLRCDRKQYGRITTTDRPQSAFGAEDVAQLRGRAGVRFLVVDRRRLRDVDCVSVRAAFAYLALPIARRRPRARGARPVVIARWLTSLDCRDEHGDRPAGRARVAHLRASARRFARLRGGPRGHLPLRVPDGGMGAEAVSRRFHRRRPVLRAQRVPHHQPPPRPARTPRPHRLRRVLDRDGSAGSCPRWCSPSSASSRWSRSWATTSTAKPCATARSAACSSSATGNRPQVGASSSS